jgi:hypothetical protein
MYTSKVSSFRKQVQCVEGGQNLSIFGYVCVGHLRVSDIDSEHIPDLLEMTWNDDADLEVMRKR